MTTVSGLLSAELAATCNALGYYDGKNYHLEPHCKETIKDLIRYLRRDDSTHEIRRYLGNAKLLQTDLLPLIQCHHEDNDLFDILLRLIVNLTNPALLLYNEVIPDDRNEHNLYLEIISHLQNYKEAFCNQRIWDPITERLGSLLNKDGDDRDEEADRTIERILILVRNVLHIPVNVQNEWRPDNDASVHDQVIWAFHQSGLMDILLYMTSSSNESNFSLHLLEIICLIVREQPPSLLAKTASERSTEEKNRDDEELLRIRQNESLAKQKKVQKFLGTRHSNFGGTYVIKNMKSTSDREMIYHKPIRDENDISLLDKDKKKCKIPKKRQSLQCENIERRSALSIRLILKQFCVELLNAAYNPLTKFVKDMLVRGKSQENDESYYFSAIKFFMEFNRNYKFQVKLVSETMSVETFHFIQKYLDKWYEMMVTDKKRIPLWSSRMHLALNAYKELLHNLALMDISKDAGVRESSKVIKSNIFYVIEYREILLSLTNNYDPSKYSRQYLKDLMETIHIFLKLLGAFTKNRKIVVQKQVKPKKKKSKKVKAPKQPPLLEENSEEQWKDVSERISAVLMSPVTVEVMPFDAASDLSMDEQKIEAVKKIQIFLKTGKIEEAVAFLRSSREIWPENDTFGTTPCTPEDEVLWFKEVFLADLQINKSLVNEVINEESNEEEEEVSDEEEEIENYQSYSEQNFNIMDLIKRFASPKIIAICNSLLQTFETNSDFTNHCVVKMLHRIAWDCQLPAMLFQASLFLTFQKIFTADNPKYKEIAKFGVYIIRKFTEIAKINKKIFVELLFYKTPKDAYEIECGYGSFAEDKSKEKIQASKFFWSEHEEEELKRLYEEFVNDKPSDDAVEWIMENLINKERSKRSVIKKMKELNLLIDKPKHRQKYTKEQESELCTLFQEFRETDDPVKCIMEKLSFTMSRNQIRNTLVRLKMVMDKSELKKKKKATANRRKNKSKFTEDDNESEERSSSDNSSDSENEELSEPSKEPPNLPLALIHLVEAMHIHSFLTEGLKWIKASMQECLEDIDDDPTEVPLLPLSADSMLSIDNKQFQQFMKALLISEPQQQEVYWRLPATWKDVDFVNRISLFEILLAHNEDELSSYLDELNVPIRKITGESCDIGKILEEIGNINIENDQNRIKESSDMISETDNFNDLIADHCRKALDNELLNEVSSNESLLKSMSNDKKKIRKHLLDDSDTTDEETVETNSLLSSSSNSKDYARKEKKKFTNKKLSNFLENTEIKTFDTKGVNEEKKKHSKRILLSDSSDDESSLNIDNKNHVLENSSSKELELAMNESGSLISNNYNSENSNIDNKRIRSDSEDHSDSNQSISKVKRKKRIVIESDED